MTEAGDAVSYAQPQDQFAAAVDDESTRIPFVMITVVNRHDGASRVLCTHPVDLMLAIAIERKQPFNNDHVTRLRAELRNKRDHVFAFSSPAALQKALNAPDSDEVCAIIRRGHFAVSADLRHATLETDQLP